MPVKSISAVAVKNMSEDAAAKVTSTWDVPAIDGSDGKGYLTAARLEDLQKQAFDEAWREGRENGVASGLGYDCLIWPVFRRRKVLRSSQMVGAEEVHQALLRVFSPFGFYTDPFANGHMQGHKFSLLNEAAGCSIWSNQEILEEKVERVQPFYRWAGHAFSLWPLRRLPFSKDSTSG